MVQSLIRKLGMIGVGKNKYLAIHVGWNGLVEPALESGMVVPLLSLQGCSCKRLLSGSLERQHCYSGDWTHNEGLD